MTLTAVTKAWGCENLSMEDCTLKTPLEGGSVEKGPLCGSYYLNKIEISQIISNSNHNELIIR